jgi:stage II sporulation protein D
MARKPSGWSKLAWWGRGVLAAWQPPRKPRSRRSAAESIAADLTIRRRASGLFVLALVAMGAVVSVLSCQTSEEPRAGRQPLRPVPSPHFGLASAEPDVRVRIRTRAASAAITAPGLVAVRPLGTTAAPVVLRAPVTITMGASGISTKDGAQSVRDWGFAVDLEIQAELPDPDRATMAVDGTRYPGKLTVRGRWRETAKAFDLISTLAMETYIAGVLQKELYDGWPKQSYQAQAIAARSYAAHERARARASSRPYDVESSTLDQAYGGLATRLVAIEAAKATRGMMLVDDATGVLRAYYSSCCGGRPATAAAIWPTTSGFEFNRAAPLQGPPRDHACERAPVYTWEVVRRNDELARRIRAWAREAGKRMATLDRIKSIVPTERNAAGKPNGYLITDVRNQTFRLGAEEMRVACNEGDPGVPGSPAVLPLPDIRNGPEHVRSNDLEFIIASPGSPAASGEIRIRGRGFGHGVGLCQYCAKGFAERGETAEAMLSLFYPGARVVKSY